MVIDVDLTGLSVQSDDIGIDNVHFAQRALSGVILTFDHNPISDFLDIDQNYGDNVTGSPDLLGHEYDSISGFEFGLTPNVTLAYGPSEPTLWTTGYGDLTNVYFNDLDGDTSLQIELTADAGFEVGLLGFDVASFIDAGQTIEGLQVRDGNGNVLFSSGSTLISGTEHNDFDFPEGLFAEVLVIDVDLTGLGVQSDDIGIDNVHFAQRAAAAPVLLGDFNQDGVVDADDIDFYSGNLGLEAVVDLDQLDLDGDGFVTLADHDLHVTTLAETSNGQTGALLGDTNLDGTVDVLNDAFALIGGLGGSVSGYANGDLNADGVVDVLGDAFRLIGNLGLTNDPGEIAAVQHSP